MGEDRAGITEASAAEAGEPPESIARASLLEVFGALTLAMPTWTILRHPFRFARYTSDPGAAIHYLYSAVALALLATAWTDAGDGGDGGDAAPVAALLNRALAVIGPHARLEGRDALPVMLLLGNIVAGLTALVVCRWIARRGADAATARRQEAGPQTLAATAYLGGAACVVYAIGLLLARGDTDALPVQAAGALLLFLTFCWGMWIRRIHGIVPGRIAGFLFPFGLAFLSFAVFAGLAAAVSLALTGTVGS